MLHIDDAADAAHGGDPIDTDHHHRHHLMSKPIEKSQAVAQSPSSWLWVNPWNDCTMLAADFCCSLSVMIIIMMAPTKSFVFSPGSTIGHTKYLPTTVTFMKEYENPESLASQ